MQYSSCTTGVFRNLLKWQHLDRSLYLNFFHSFIQTTVMEKDVVSMTLDCTSGDVMYEAGLLSETFSLCYCFKGHHKKYPNIH